MKKFFDTSALLAVADSLSDYDNMVVSDITLKELESIKTSAHKDIEQKYLARKVTRFIDKANIEIAYFKPKMVKPFIKAGFDTEANDIKILATAFNYLNLYDIIFYTNDISLKNLAKQYLPDVQKALPKEDTYNGYLEVIADSDELARFYQNKEENIYGLLPNQYLILKGDDGTIYDRLCWTGETHRELKYGNLDSKLFGKVKPLKGDIQQQFLVDSFLTNELTMATGKAGSGKSLLSLAFLFHLLERGEIDRIIIFCNTVAVKGAAKLGLYPGSKDEKLLDSQIGHILTTKLGSRMIVEDLIENEQLILLPLSDCRGVSIPPHSGVYMTEAQNTNKELMKLALQRIEEGCKIIVEGDREAQVDLDIYDGKNNGMQRLSQVFRGQDYFGQVELQACHRGRVPDRAELM